MNGNNIKDEKIFLDDDDYDYIHSDNATLSSSSSSSFGMFEIREYIDDNNIVTRTEHIDLLEEMKSFQSSNSTRDDDDDSNGKKKNVSNAFNGLSNNGDVKQSEEDEFIKELEMLARRRKMNTSTSTVSNSSGNSSSNTSSDSGSCNDDILDKLSKLEIEEKDLYDRIKMEDRKILDKQEAAMTKMKSKPHKSGWGKGFLASSSPTNTTASSSSSTTITANTSTKSNKNSNSNSNSDISNSIKPPTFSIPAVSDTTDTIFVQKKEVTLAKSQQQEQYQQQSQHKQQQQQSTINKPKNTAFNDIVMERGF